MSPCSPPPPGGKSLGCLGSVDMGGRGSGNSRATGSGGRLCHPPGEGLWCPQAQAPQAAGGAGEGDPRLGRGICPGDTTPERKGAVTRTSLNDGSSWPTPFEPHQCSFLPPALAVVALIQHLLCVQHHSRYWGYSGDQNTGRGQNKGSAEHMTRGQISNKA